MPNREFPNARIYVPSPLWGRRKGNIHYGDWLYRLNSTEREIRLKQYLAGKNPSSKECRLELYYTLAFRGIPFRDEHEVAEYEALIEELGQEFFNCSDDEPFSVESTDDPNG